MTTKKEESKSEGKCFKCGNACTEDHYCHGCGTHVCSECSISNPWGSHSPEDHLEEEEEDDGD